MKRSFKKGITGIRDLDLLILSELDNKDLISVCLTSKYIYDICNTDNFWKNRVVKSFGESYVKYKPDTSTWKQYYVRTIIDREQIQNAMIKQIRCDLTVGREDYDLRPYKEKEVNNFIIKHSKQLEEAVVKMYETYRDDNDLDDLRKAELDWYKEFLYEYIPFLDERESEA